MPILDLPALHNGEAGVYLLSVMCSPRGDDREHQRLVEAARNQAVGNVLRRNDTNIPSTSRAIDLTVKAAKGPQLAEVVADLAHGGTVQLFTRNGHHRGLMAGMLLTFVLAYAEHDPMRASKESAYRMLEKANTDARLPDRSRPTLIKAFNDYEPVAHFWAAACIAPSIWDQSSTSGSHLARFLGMAETLRRKAEGVKLDQGMLLDPALTWTVPDRFVLPDWNLEIPTPAALAAAMTRWPRAA